MDNIYGHEVRLENARFLLRFVIKEDAGDLLAVYSDKNALPFFNSDNCHGDNFYYPTLERMNQAIDFWRFSYEKGFFVRWSIVDKTIGKAIGTVELFIRSSDDGLCGGLLRLDLRSDYEDRQSIENILALLLPMVPEYFGSTVITKAPIYAVERIAALQALGFAPSEHLLVGENGYAYNGYWVKKYDGL
ncbi:MAG: GNAT family N-acetyltransferase [Faecousia sp.]